MKVKKFNQLNENNTFSNYYKIEKDNKFYYGVVDPSGLPIIFDAYGVITDIDDLSDADVPTQIKYEDLPKEVADAYNATIPTDEEIQIDKVRQDKMLQPKEKSYSDMGQNELNYQLNLALDSGDYKTAKEISQYLKESKVFKFKGFLSENKDNIYINLIWWLEYEWEWDYVENEGMDRQRFDWDNGNQSFWLNSDLTGEGTLPPKIKQTVIDKGIKLED